VEQVIGQPGSIRRIHAVVVVRKPLDAAQEEKVQRLLAAAVGAVTERGDTVVVQPLAALPANGDSVLDDAGNPVSSASSDGKTPLNADTRLAADAGLYARIAVGLILLAVAGGAVFLLRRSRPQAATRLNDAQRAAALQRIQHWMQQDETAAPKWPAPSRDQAGGLKA
jgi:flagellar M-ring protein FliF